MVQINVVGDIFNATGYASHTRGIANALFNLVPTRLSVPIVPNWNMQVNDRELEMIKRKQEKDEINVIVTNPLYWKLSLGHGRNWCYLVWEGDKVPRCFIDECMNEKIEYILVPSVHTMNALINTLINSLKDFNVPVQIIIAKKIKIIPHGVDINLFYPKEKPNKTIFIANKGLRGPEDRGGLQYLLKAYLEEFSEADQTELIMRINPIYGLIDIDKLIGEMVKPENKKYPKLTIQNQPMDYKDLVKLYNQGTVFVSPTRAEAFNIPCIEAMACGLPVITTNFGGQTDYVNDSNGWIIGGKFAQVTWDMMYEGINWLTPDIDDLKKKMREVHNGMLWKEKREEAIETAKKYTWDISCHKLLELM